MLKNIASLRFQIKTVNQFQTKQMKPALVSTSSFRSLAFNERIRTAEALTAIEYLTMQIPVNACPVQSSVHI